jgi:hypothetical protein
VNAVLFANSMKIQECFCALFRLPTSMRRYTRRMEFQLLRNYTRGWRTGHIYLLFSVGLGEVTAPPPPAWFVDLVRTEWSELPPLSYLGYYEVAAAEDMIGNDIGVNHDNGVKPLAEDPIGNGTDANHDNCINPLVIGDDYGGRDSVIKPICSSPKPNHCTFWTADCTNELHLC